MGEIGDALHRWEVAHDAFGERYLNEVLVGRPGSHTALAAALDAYHAANLREALKLVPDNGDWHGSLRTACDMVLADHPDARPNQTAEQMAVRVQGDQDA